VTVVPRVVRQVDSIQICHKGRQSSLVMTVHILGVFLYERLYVVQKLLEG
jgi:hypothetical protein